jgi:hypothetical protein
MLLEVRCSIYSLTLVKANFMTSALLAHAMVNSFDRLTDS